MKIHPGKILLTLCCSAMILLSHAQVNNANKIKEIKANYKQVNQKKNWSAIKNIDLNESTEGGQASFYYLNNQLLKVIVNNYGESGRNLREYYLMKGRLSFVFHRDFTYNRPMYYDSASMKENNDTEVWDFSKSKIKERRYYFASHQLLQQINNPPGKSSFSAAHLKKEGKEITTEFDRMVKLSQ